MKKCKHCYSVMDSSEKFCQQCGEKYTNNKPYISIIASIFALNFAIVIFNISNILQSNNKIDGSKTLSPFETSVDHADIIETTPTNLTTITNTTITTEALTEKTSVNAAKPNTKKSPPSTLESQTYALKKVNNYLQYSSFSYNGLINQLEFDGFSLADAVYAINNCGADWNEQAVKMAQDYLKYNIFSYRKLLQELQYEGFTYDQAIYGVENCGADWNEQAALKVKSLLKYYNFSQQELIEMLQNEGFTYEQAVYGINKQEYNK